MLARRGILLALSFVALTAGGGCGDSDEPSGASSGQAEQSADEHPGAGLDSSSNAQRSDLRVIQRPRTGQDQLPRFAEAAADSYLGGYEVATEKSRYVGKREGVRLYAVPGPRDLCLFTADGAGGCATQEQAESGGLVGVQIGPPLLAEDEVRAWGTVPDGARFATASFKEGADERIAVTENVWVIRTHRRLTRVRWKSDQGPGESRLPAF